MSGRLLEAQFAPEDSSDLQTDGEKRESAASRPCGDLSLVIEVEFLKK
jgi:hypothetical protein